MTPRCSLCGTFESENTTVIPDFEACYDCIHSLVENEIERRNPRSWKDFGIPYVRQGTLPGGVLEGSIDGEHWFPLINQTEAQRTRQ